VSARAARPVFFADPAQLRAWFVEHHKHAAELIVGFYKRDSGRPSITWPESVDEALCVGWIDGIRRSIDVVSYQIRFTPRKPTSTWSAINIARVAVLTKEERMLPAGLAAFAARRANRSGIYAYEQRSATLPPKYARIFKTDAAAWKFFQSQTPGYRKQMMWRIVSAKQEATREKRLALLMKHSARGERLPGVDAYKTPRAKKTTRSAKPASD
jgi:uncharacterized protein YdeI (YjbR/CyaY-like superfamily)